MSFDSTSKKQRASAQSSKRSVTGAKQTTSAQTLMRMRARLYIQYARALYVSKDMSCCFYVTEGLKLAQMVGSQYNIRQARDLAAELAARFPRDERVGELLREL